MTVTTLPWVKIKIFIKIIFFNYCGKFLVIVYFDIIVLRVGKRENIFLITLSPIILINKCRVKDGKSYF